MNMHIRPAHPNDIDALMAIFDAARRFMEKQGNPNQWINGYPAREFILQEITDGHCFVCETANKEVVGTFCFILGDDPTYAYIEEGEWCNHEPYAVIHRMASSGKVRGIADECMKWCFDHCRNIRVDTHQDNIVMQNIFIKHGFKRCGIIYVKNGTPRIAFQKTI